jgi:5-methylcytosine-specific restriction endonuclease McrA
MAFSEETKRQALKNARGKCEKCGRDVTMSTCHAHHKNHAASGGPDVVSNCRILCVRCHKEIHA